MKMRKIVINDDYGGFGLSDDGFERYKSFGGKSERAYNIPRDDNALVKVIESMGAAANDCFSVLKIVEIPEDVEWEIEEHDGMEWVTEKHRTWR